MEEQWKSIPSAPGYQASSEGRIRGIRGRVLALHLSSRDYWQVSVRTGGKWKGRRVHRLVCEAFHGLAPFAHDACHLDGDKDNNRATNLAWGTRAENNSHKAAHGTSMRGTENPSARLTEDQVREIRNSGLSHRRLARAYGITRSAVWQILSRRTWNHI
jgi:hypothetical protein